MEALAHDSAAHNGFDLGNNGFGDNATLDDTSQAARLTALIAAVKPANVKVHGFQTRRVDLPSYTVPVTNGDGVTVPKVVQVKSVDGKPYELIDFVAFSPLSEAEETRGKYTEIVHEMVNQVIFPPELKRTDDIACLARLALAKVVRPQYERWKARTGAPVTGRPLSTFPGVPNIYLPALKSANITTLEELAATSPERLKAIPGLLDGEELQRIAQRELDKPAHGVETNTSVSSSVALDKLVKEQEAMLKAQADQLTEMRDMLAQLLPAKIAEAKAAETAKPKLTLPGKAA